MVGYQQEYPKIRIEVHDGGRDQHIAALRARELDVVFVPGECEYRNRECVELWSEPLHIASPTRHMLAERRTLDRTPTVLGSGNEPCGRGDARRSARERPSLCEGPNGLRGAAMQE
ncbi:hypothetical protein D1F64_08335 [Breoghania sp. L-A4]|nr:hypothetical protein D1F64_08335 [Breoghania sp. L-A4]